MRISDWSSDVCSSDLVYAVASGACDIALAMGAEKLKDTGYGGLPVRTRGTTHDMVGITGSAPGNFAQLASAYRGVHGVGKDDLKRAMAHVSVKSHANGAKNPTAHLQKAGSGRASGRERGCQYV